MTTIKQLSIDRYFTETKENPIIKMVNIWLTEDDFTKLKRCVSHTNDQLSDKEDFMKQFCEEFLKKAGV